MRQLISIVTAGVLAGPVLAGQIAVVTPPNIVVPTPSPVVAPPTLTPTVPPVVAAPVTPVTQPAAPAVTPGVATPGASPGATPGAGQVAIAPSVGGGSSVPLTSVQGFNVGTLSAPQAQAAVGLIQQALSSGNLSRAERQVLTGQLGQLRAQLGQ
jgi:hypothetical protein